jgi:uncharacterized membrane protein YsdA (DUF1294 family)
VLGFALCLTVGLLLALWRLGLAPVYGALVGINVVTLLLYGYDKRQAVVGATRVPELALHTGALLGGSPGAFLGQQLFRHKTRKFRFQVVFVAIVVFQVAAMLAYWRYLRG